MFGALTLEPEQRQTNACFPELELSVAFWSYSLAPGKGHRIWARRVNPQVPNSDLAPSIELVMLGAQG